MDRTSITIPSAIPMVALVGPNDSYIKILEGAFPNIAITVRGNEIHANGNLSELQKFDELVKEFSSATYFPAYEIVLDDLRDYRWYKHDLIHITEEAEEYVWGKFKDTFFIPAI